MGLFHAINLTSLLRSYFVVSFLVKMIFRLQFHLDEGLDHGVLHVLVHRVQELVQAGCHPLVVKIPHHLLSIVQPHTVGAA